VLVPCLVAMQLQTTPLICETEPSKIQFLNGSDHAVIACYLELYEEGEVKHINGPQSPKSLNYRRSQKANDETMYYYF